MIPYVLAAAVTAVCATPAPATAAPENLLGSAPERTPSPKRVQIERHVALVANVLRYLEDHLGVELVPASVERADVRMGYVPGPSALAAGPELAPAVAGTFAFGDAGPVSAARLRTVVSASPDRVRLTLRLRW